MTKAERRALNEKLAMEENLNSQPTSNYNPGEFALDLTDIIFSPVAVVLCLLIVTLITFITFETLHHSNRSVLEQKEMVKANYTEYSFFLDGEPVNYSNIDIDQYNFSVDNETKKVYLTKRTRRSSSIPIAAFIPHAVFSVI